MDQRIEGVHPQQARRHDGIVDHRLEDDGSPADAERRDQHDRQLWNPQAHGVAEIFHIHIQKEIEHGGGRCQQR